MQTNLINEISHVHKEYANETNTFKLSYNNNNFNGNIQHNQPASAQQSQWKAY